MSALKTYTSRPELWAKKSAADPLRVNCIARIIGETLERVNARKVLDIGCGTGTVAHAIIRSFDLDSEWVLLDQCEAMLSEAQKVKIEGWDVHFEAMDFFDYADSGRSFDAMIAVFTLMEIENLDDFFKSVVKLATEKSKLLVVLPDIIEDVLSAVEARQITWQDYIYGQVRLRKIDKYTGLKYPFIAHRIESILVSATAASLKLSACNLYKNNSSIFVMEFDVGF